MDTEAQSDAALFLERGDRPVTALAEDTMGRTDFARALAEELLRPRADGGCVLGLTGAWGSGKTSLINMTVDALGDRAVVVQFNPWLFSGTEALVSLFFREIAKQLARRKTALTGVAQKMATYGRLFAPAAALVGAGGAVAAAAQALEGLLAEPSAHEQREGLIAELAKLERRLVVVIDDVDRLRPDEVRDIVRLVRLVGDFPSTVYLLAFDRDRVEECLGEGSRDRGRAYLEKIVQATFDVPAAHTVDVHTVLREGLMGVLGDVEHSPFDLEQWENLYSFVLGPLFTTPRDVARYLSVLPMTLGLIGDEVALQDVLTLEAVRVLRPEVFAEIRTLSSALCEASSGGQAGGQRPEDSLIGSLVQADPRLAQAMCTWLFPAARRYFESISYGGEFARRWRWERRVASLPVLRYYLECRLPDSLVPAATMEQIHQALGDSETLRTALQELTPEQLYDALDRLRARYAEIPFDSQADPTTDPAAAALPVLLEQVPRVPIRHEGIFTLYPRDLARQACRGLLSRISDEDARAQVIGAVADSVPTISAQVYVVQAVLRSMQSQSPLMAEPAYKALEESLVGQVDDTSVDDLTADPDVYVIVLFLQHVRPAGEGLARLLANDGFIIALLTSAVTVTSSQTIGAAAITRIAALPWQNLVAIFGDEPLRRRVEQLVASVAADDLQIGGTQQAVLELAARYAAGDDPTSDAD
jgi:hypothetical protein